MISERAYCLRLTCGRESVATFRAWAGQTHPLRTARCRDGFSPDSDLLPSCVETIIPRVPHQVIDPVAPTSVFSWDQELFRERKAGCLKIDIYQHDAVDVKLEYTPRCPM